MQQMQMLFMQKYNKITISKKKEKKKKKRNIKNNFINPHVLV